MQPTENNLFDHFRRNPVPYIVAAIILLVALPIVLRVGLAVFGVAFSVAGAALGMVFGVLGAILLLAVRFIWLIAIMTIIWWVINRRPWVEQPEKKKKRPAAPPQETIYHYDENGDAYLYEDELFDEKRQQRR
jgi:membrane protein implicated in regulation of membrane protease activity